MKTITRTLFVSAALALTSGALADQIIFQDQVKNQTVEKADLTAESIYTVEFRAREKGSSNRKVHNFRPWDVRSVTIDSMSTDVGIKQMIANWNAVMSKYSRDVLKLRELEDVNKLFEDRVYYVDSKEKNDDKGQDPDDPFGKKDDKKDEVEKKKMTREVVKDLDDISKNLGRSLLVWGHAARIRILTQHGAVDTKGLEAFEEAIKKWEGAATEYAAFLNEKREYNRLSQPVGGKGHPFAALDGSRIHSSAMQVWRDISDYYLRAKQYNLAWERGGQFVGDIAQGLLNVTRDDSFLSAWATPHIDHIASSVANIARESEGESATNAWRVAEKAYESLVVLAKRMKDNVATGRAELSLADAQIWIGETAKANATYSRYVNAFQRAMDEAKSKPVADPMGKEGPSVIALAFNGLGKIEFQRGKYGEALRNFAKSTTNFSADKEARAEAVLFSGLCYAKLAADGKTSKAAKAYLLRMAESMMSDLTLTLNETAVFGRRATLASAIEAAQK